MSERATVAAALGFWLLAFGHAVATWPARAVLVLFVGGAAVVAAVEAVPTRLDLRRVHVALAVAGVPVWALLVQPASVYATYRAGAIAFGDGLRAAGFAAALVTAAALRTTPNAVAAGQRSYPPSGASALRYRGVPWWSFAGRFVVALALSLAVQPFL